MTTRAAAKAQTRERLLSAAREAVREQGPSALALRDVARRAGVVPSAVYKHVASRDALLTELILEAYAGVAEALETAEQTDAGRRWTVVANALRTWALAHRHEFQLIYGSPVPDYRAPAQTVPAATRVAAVFLRAAGEDPGGATAELESQLVDPAAQLGVDPGVLARVLADLAQLVGLLTLELGGHLVGTADPADALWDAVLARQQAASA